MKITRSSTDFKVGVFCLNFTECHIERSYMYHLELHVYSSFEVQVTVVYIDIGHILLVMYYLQ